MRWAIAWLAASVMVGCGQPGDGGPPRRDALTTDWGEATVEIVPRTPYLATYPCGLQCHDDREPDPTPRELVSFHAGREIDHGPGLDWCGDCHSIDDPDRLHLLSGVPVGFDESDRICGQCHGPKHRDWEHGVHGLTTGGWIGTVSRRLCTACHNPHGPDRIEFEALPPPEPDPRVTGEFSWRLP